MWTLFSPCVLFVNTTPEEKKSIFKCHFNQTWNGNPKINQDNRKWVWHDKGIANCACWPSMPDIATSKKHKQNYWVPRRSKQRVVSVCVHLRDLRIGKLTVKYIFIVVDEMWEHLAKECSGWTLTNLADKILKKESSRWSLIKETGWWILIKKTGR